MMWKEWTSRMNALAAVITKLKQKMVEAGPFAGFFHLAALFFLQAALVLISLPVFVFLPASSYKKYYKNPGTADVYQMRRLIILAATGGILILLALRMLTGIIINASSDSAGAHPSAEDLLALKSGKIVADEKSAVIQNVEYKNFGNDVVFKGIAPAKSRIMLFVDAGGELVYKTMADSSGFWKVTHSQDTANLPPGPHTVNALAYSDSDPGTYSYSNAFDFTYDSSRWSVFARTFNPGIILLFLGAVMALWITHLKLKKA